VGIITPHTEQQAFIGKLASDHPRSEELYDRLRLKVMTFDTCQGEEREIIFYPLVATAEKDRLAYVFPSKLDRDQSAEVDHNLRLQRLNVGLSRGQEKIVFVHSKDLAEYSSAIQVALSHYKNELSRPTDSDVDEGSPMERRAKSNDGSSYFRYFPSSNCAMISQSPSRSRIRGTWLSQ
jgi:superfamily I DNA and/or RNA helicase